MRDTLAAWWEVWSRKRALGATAELLRVFLVCSSCRRVVPFYRISGPARAQRAGCKCGSQSVRPGIPSYLGGAAWVIGALVWRKWIRRLGDGWDPRAPIRGSELRGAR